MKYLYGFIIDGDIYLDLVDVAHRSPHWKKEFNELCEAYEPEACFVIKEDSGLVVNEGTDSEDLEEDTYQLLKDLIGYVSLEGLNEETYEVLIDSGDYQELSEYITEDEELEDEELEDAE